MAATVGCGAAEGSSEPTSLPPPLRLGRTRVTHLDYPIPVLYYRIIDASIILPCLGFVKPLRYSTAERFVQPQWWQIRWVGAAGSEKASVTDSALEGLQVLDLSQKVSGAYCGKLLACYGAEVWKIEPPGSGDPTRHEGLHRGDGRNDDTGALFLYLNTGKKSCTLNLDVERGREVLRRLAATADILIEDAGPGGMEERGLGYRELSAVNPDLIYVSLSPFGSDGPYADYQATQLTLYALGGYMYLTGDPDREPLQGPGHQPAYLAGAHAVAGVMIALWARESGAGGQHVDVGELESIAVAHQWTTTRYNYAGMIQRRMGNRYDLGHPNTLYACRDGYITISAASEKQAERLFLVLGQPELSEDERFRNGIARRFNADALDEIIGPWFAERTRDEVVQLCQEMRVPCAPVSEVDDVLEHEQLNAREFWRELDHPEAGRLRYTGPPFHMPDSPGQIGRAPLLGEHNEEIYKSSAGLSSDEVAGLREEGAI